MRHLLFTSSQLTGQNLWIRWKTKILMYYLFLSDPSLIIALPCQSVTESIFALVETWLMGPWRVKIHATSPCLTSCCQFWHSCCWRWNKTKAILLMSEPAKAMLSSIFIRPKYLAMFCMLHWQDTLKNCSEILENCVSPCLKKIYSWNKNSAVLRFL